VSFMMDHITLVFLPGHSLVEELGSHVFGKVILREYKGGSND
jgi:hypothetical protein